MAGGARAAEREPRRGKHRRGSAGTTWNPEITAALECAATCHADGKTTDPPAAAHPASQPPVAHAWPETPPTGLRKFNLGTVPASVTPPPTWRRAAWFVIGTAVFVVLALGFAAFRLVGNPKRDHTIDALPGQPSQQLLVADLPGRYHTTTPSMVRHTGGHGPSARSATADTSASGPAGTTSMVQPTRASPGVPVRRTATAVSVPLTDPEQMGDRTELYYVRVTEDPVTAWEMTSGMMRSHGPAGIAARYSGVGRIEVREIFIDPYLSYTRSMLTIVRKNGSTVTVEHELTFSSGADPKITSDNAAFRGLLSAPFE